MTSKWASWVESTYNEEMRLKQGGSPGGSDGKESAYIAGDPGSITGWGRFPGEGNGNPFQ